MERVYQPFPCKPATIPLEIFLIPAEQLTIVTCHMFTGKIYPHICFHFCIKWDAILKHKSSFL